MVDVVVDGVRYVPAKAAISDGEAAKLDAALDYVFECHDRDGKTTLREYLRDLLQTLLDEDEGFSGKRPFGNSGWWHNFPMPLVATGLIAGEIHDYTEEDGGIECDGYDPDEVDRVMKLLVQHIFTP